MAKSFLTRLEQTRSDTRLVRLKLEKNKFELWLRIRTSVYLEESETNTLLENKFDIYGTRNYVFTNEYIQAQWEGWQGALTTRDKL